MSDDNLAVVRLLNSVRREIDSALGHLEETFPPAEDLEEWMADWDLPAIHQKLLQVLTTQADAAMSQVEQFKREVIAAIKRLESDDAG